MGSQTKVAQDPAMKSASPFQWRNTLLLFATLLAVAVSGSFGVDEVAMGAGMQPVVANATTPQGNAAQFADVARLVVMIEATVDGVPSQGAGVIFAVKDNTAYVLTANHVVRSKAAARNIRVYFSTNPDASVPATTLPQYSADLDLAVLEVDVTTVDLQSEKLLPFELLMGNSSKLVQGSPVFPIGYPEGYKWASPLLAPDRFDRLYEQRLYFQSRIVKVGFSGGAVCSADWHVVGIVLAVAQEPVVMALPIEAAMQQIQGWGLEVGAAKSTVPARAESISPIVKTDRVTSNPTDGGLKEGKTVNGAVYRTFSPWGGFSSTDPTWVQIVAQKIEGIPPQRTTFGNTPSFALVMSTTSGMNSTVGLRATQVTFKPGSEDDLDGALIRLIASSMFSTWDVTFPAAITFPKVRQSQKLVLRYVDKVMQEVRDQTDTTEVTMFARAQQFLPDAKSGDDANPGTAEVIAPGVLKEDSVSFDDSEATHHKVLNPNGTSCNAFLWVESTGEVGLTSTARQVDEGSLSLVLEGPGEPKTTLYDVQCEDKRTILRVQAEKPGSSAKYYLFVRSGPNESVPQLEAPMVQDWIDSWVSTKKGTFDFKKVTTSEWNAIDRGLEKIRQYTSRAPNDFILSLNNSLDKGTGDSFSGIAEGYWNFLESLVSRHRDEISTALPNCCSTSTKIRFMTNLLRAEANLPYDRAALEWAKTQSGLPETMQTRVKRFVAWNPPPTAEKDPN